MVARSFPIGPQATTLQLPPSAEFLCAAADKHEHRAWFRMASEANQSLQARTLHACLEAQPIQDAWRYLGTYEYSGRRWFIFEEPR